MSDTPQGFHISTAPGVDVGIDDRSPDGTYTVTVRKDGVVVETHRGVSDHTIGSIQSPYFSATPTSAADSPPVVPPQMPHVPSVPIPPSDSGGQPPPPPGYGDPAGGAPGYAATGQPPPPDYGTSAGYGAPPGYAPATGFAERPPRPDAKLGAALIIAGAVISAIGVFLPWIDDGGETRNGTDLFFTSDAELLDGPGNLVLALSFVLAGLGVALFLAGRVLAVAIIAIVVSGIALLMGLGMVGIANDDILGGDLGIGAILQPIAPLAAVAGSIIVTAKRRR